MIDKLTMFFDQKLSGPMEKLGRQRHLQAIRNGIVATLPLISRIIFLNCGNATNSTRLGIISVFKR